MLMLKAITVSVCSKVPAPLKILLKIWITALAAIQHKIMLGANKYLLME